MSLFRRLFDVARSQISSENTDIDVTANATGSQSTQPRESFTPKARTDSEKSRTGRANAVDSVDARYYANLELEPGADYAQIKTAYRNLLRQYHPDRHHKNPEQSALALEITKRLNEAMDHFEKKFARERA